jgi:MFS family permease
MEVFHIGILLSAFVIVFILLQFLGGWLSDRVGRRLPILSGLVLIGASLIVMPTLNTLPSLVMVMVSLGAAYALLFPSISALITDFSAPGEFGQATGIFHALLTAGVALGAPVMGFVAQGLGVEPGLALSSITVFIASIVVWFDFRRK